MRRFIKAASLIIYLLPLSAYAQESEPKDTGEYSERIESTVITAGRMPVFLGKSPRMVTVLDSLAISGIPAGTINDILKYAVGVDVRQRGAEGIQTDISIRGGTCEQIAVLLDGINIGDPQTGHNTVDFPVPVSEIERIEILEGPAARTYGTSSLLGAINIVTKSGSSRGKELRLEAGTKGLFSASAAVRNLGGKIKNSLSAGFSRSDGYSRNQEGGLNTDFKKIKAFYKGKADTGPMLLRWHAGLSVKDFGSSTFYSPKYDNQFEHTAKLFTALQGEAKGKLHLRPRIYWNYSEDRFELFRGSPDKYPFNYHRTNVTGGNIDGWLETSLGKTAYGMEIRREAIASTNLGDPLDKKIKVRGKDAYYVVGLHRTDLSFFLEHNITFGKFSFSGGAGISKNTGNDEGFKIYPGIDATYNISRNLKIYASYNSSLRMPSFTELYYSVGGYKADKNLKAEKMQAVDAGLKYLGKGVRIVGSLYYHKGKDMIDWIRDLSIADAPWQSVNHAEINSLGYEATVRLEPEVLLGKPSCPLKSLSIAYAHIHQDKKAEANIQSYYSLEYLRNKIVAQAELLFPGNIMLNLGYRWHDRIGSSNYKPYSLVDCKVSRDFGQKTLYIEANNLLNAEYFDHGNIPQPGIWVKIGAIFRL